VVLGDSFTFGDEVSDDETYSHYLQELLPDAEVINMGIHGYGHDQMLILLEEVGIKYEPDIVILGFVPMDMARNLLNFRDFAKPRFTLGRGGLELVGTPVPTPADLLRWDWARPRILDLFSIIRFTVKKWSGSNEKETEKITNAILTKMIEVVDRVHATPLFVYVPTADEIASPNPGATGEAYLSSLCRANRKVKCLSAKPLFAEYAARGIVFKQFGHWDPTGHRVVAEAIYTYLVGAGYAAEP